MGINRMLSTFSLLLICTAVITSRAAETELHDAKEGDDITLKCRFSPDPTAGESLTYYWVRSIVNSHDNVAIGNIPLETNYQILYAPEDGRYDLMVSKVSYERDNGKFECRVKAGGSGRVVHSQAYQVVVLSKPHAPQIEPGSYAQAQEGTLIILTCSTFGGSPEPSIKWYKNTEPDPLDAKLVHGKTRAELSSSKLTLMPTREDDGAIFRCVVWNRAMPENSPLDASVELSVNCGHRPTKQVADSPCLHAANTKHFKHAQFSENY